MLQSIIAIKRFKIEEEKIVKKRLRGVGCDSICDQMGLLQESGGV